MECRENMCLLEELHPNTEASLACDCDCHLGLKRSKEVSRLYKQQNPELWDKIMKE